MVNNTYRLPDIYIVGAQKCGTTSFYDWLAQHPDVYGNTAAKDIPFFAMDDVYAKGLEHLANFFRKSPPSSLIVGGEVSAMFIPEAIARLHAAIPNAKLIVMIRNPVDRAFSAWQFAVERGVEVRSFEQSITDEIKGVSYEKNIVNLAYKDYLARGKYAEQLEALFEYYSRESVHVIFFEELRDNPQKIFDNLCGYIGLSNFKPVFDAKNVTQGGARFKWLQRFLYIPRTKKDVFARIVRRIVPYQIRFALRETLERFNRVSVSDKQKITPEARQKLAEFFREDMERLVLLKIKDHEELRKLGWGR